MRIGTLEQKKATIPEENVKSVKKAPTKGKRISAEEIRAKVAANKSQTPEKLKLNFIELLTPYFPTQDITAQVVA